MTRGVNIYCDESCHLERDAHKVMVLGAVWCPLEKSREISERLREIKSEHKLQRSFEIKWTKVSPGQLRFYLDVMDYFFDDDDLHFRGVVIPDKSKLDHAAFGQDHDDWYYKMCFRLLEPIIDPSTAHYVYLDIKDTRSEVKRKKLEQVLRNSRGDPYGRIIRRVQQIRSHESELMALADLILGAVGYANRTPQASPAKRSLVERLRKRSGKRLDRSTWLREMKFNLFRWEGARP